jgi:hypothetical protein
MDKVQNKPYSFVQHTPSSESFKVINSGLKCQLFGRDWNGEVIVDFETLNSFDVLILGGEQQQSVEALCTHKPFRDFTNILKLILKWILER